MANIPSHSPLSGRTIAIPESRKLDIFAKMLEKQGAVTWRCPLVSIHDAPDPAPVVSWLHKFAGDQMDDLILLTGEGVRRLHGFADRAGDGLQDQFINSLKKVRRITRGPKPVVALRQLGLNTDLSAGEPTTDGVIDLLSGETLKGRKVGVQLYGNNPNEKLMEFLKKAGAEVSTVAPYVYANDSENIKVSELIEAIIRKELDAIAFTSSQQVKRLFQVAKKQKTADILQEGLNKIIIAAVGPVVRDTLTEREIQVELMPKSSFFMKPLTDELVLKLK
ncbi:MAG: uroporphyrinogen-III synthase [Balneolales bacterium]